MPYMLLLLLAAITAAPFTGKVVSVTDGDTIRIYVDGDRATTKVRLDAIDAPEKGQPFGTVSRQYLAKLANGKQCKVRNMGTDKYGRVLGIVTVDGTVLNAEMVRAGLAWHYKKYSKSKTLAKLEDEARKAKRGLWADPKPVPPWEWRNMSKDARTRAIAGRVAPAEAVSVPSSEPPGAELTHWLNPKSNIRHNSGCRWYGKTKNGRKCTAGEGKPCSQCGG